MNQAPRLVIVGATGWYGRVLLHEYCSTYGEKQARKNLLLVASKDCTVSVKLDGEIYVFDVISLKKISSINLSSYETLYWYAFLLKNKIDLYGANIWRQINDDIANDIFNLLKIYPHLRTIFFSSGAALGWDSLPDYELDPYAHLKMTYGELLRASGSSIIVYPYATSGSYLSSIESFALSSFIKQALDHKTIKIEANIPVIRSYGSAHDFSRLLLKFSEQDNWNDLPKKIVPVTHTLELQQLANEVLAALSIKASISRPQLLITKKPSIYAADSFEFPALMAQWGLVSTALDAQIRGMASHILGDGLK